MILRVMKALEKIMHCLFNCCLMSLADWHTLLKLRQLFQQTSLTCAGLSCNLQASLYVATFKTGI